jgi:dihydroxy-acid dehydratase
MWIKRKSIVRLSLPGVLIEAVKNNLKPRDIITKKSIENAVSVIMAVGGSTNAVLHFLAIASAAEVDWTIDDFERIRRKVPVIVDMKPSGKFLATDLHLAGGIPQVMKILLEAGLLHGDCMTITGKTITEVLKDVPATPRADQHVIRPITNPMYQQGHLAILKGNISPEGCVAKNYWLKKSKYYWTCSSIQLRRRLHGSYYAEQNYSWRCSGYSL